MVGQRLQHLDGGGNAGVVGHYQMPVVVGRRLPAARGPAIRMSGPGPAGPVGRRAVVVIRHFYRQILAAGVDAQGRVGSQKGGRNAGGENRASAVVADGLCHFDGSGGRQDQLDVRTGGGRLKTGQFRAA